MRFSRQEYWSELPFPPPGDLSEPGIEPMSLASPAWVGRFFTTAPPEVTIFLVWVSNLYIEVFLNCVVDFLLAAKHSIYKLIANLSSKIGSIKSKRVSLYGELAELFYQVKWKCQSLSCVWLCHLKEVNMHFLPQGIFPTQGSNSGLLHCRWVPYPLSHPEVITFSSSRLLWVPEKNTISPRPAGSIQAARILETK